MAEDDEGVQVAIDDDLYRDLQALRGAEREKILNELLRRWSKSPDWVLDFSANQLAAMGSCLRFVVDEFSAGAPESVREKLLECEERGDWDFVAQYVERGGPIEEDDLELRQAVARIMRAKNKRKTREPKRTRAKKRPRAIKTEYDAFRRVYRVRALMHLGQEEAAAKKLVAEQENKTLRQVQDDYALLSAEVGSVERVILIILRFVAYFICRSLELGALNEEQAERFQEQMTRAFCDGAVIPEYRFTVRRAK
jgi:hypothetical protein